jgi:hypothetical protein
MKLKDVLKDTVLMDVGVFAAGMGLRNFLLPVILLMAA